MRNRTSQVKVATLSQTQQYHRDWLRVPAAFALAAFALLLPACTNGSNEEIGTEVEEIQGEVNEYVGQEVTVSGEVVEIVDDNAFVLQGEDLFGGERIVVLSSSPAENIVVGETAIVTGTVRDYTVAEVEEDFGLDLAGSEYEVDLEQRAAIVAEATQVQ